jgi:hypothetical protein
MARADRARSGLTFRCAIYTRKSSDEGLEQEFNSLDAQREACEAYIVSQRHAGWVMLPDMYDDGGLSGGTMERPALKRVLEDIEASKVQIVVVYKVDRLTWSLSDFAKIVDVLDARNASFVSVTQQFNTTTSMGRLTVNMLLSFAQFEREIAGERIRQSVSKALTAERFEADSLAGGPGFEPGLPESESLIRIRLQSSSTPHRFGPIAERHGPADPEPFALRICDLVTHARARAKVDEGPFANLNATRRKLAPCTWLAISALHLIENRLDVATAGMCVWPAICRSNGCCLRSTCLSLTAVMAASTGRRRPDSGVRRDLDKPGLDATRRRIFEQSPSQIQQPPAAPIAKSIAVAGDRNRGADEDVIRRREIRNAREMDVEHRDQRRGVQYSHGSRMVLLMK